MGGAESIVDVDVAEAGKRRAELGNLDGIGLHAGAVFELHFTFFFDVETEVFEEQDFTGLEGLRSGFSFRANAAWDELHRAAQELLELDGDRTQGELLNDLTVRTAEVRHQHQGGTAFQEELDGR